MGSIEAESLENGFLVFEFWGEIFKAVAGGNQWVGCRVPDLVIDSIENSNQILGTLPKQTFEADSEFVSLLNLPRIGRADCRYQVRKSDPDLHKIHQPVELKGTGVIKLRFAETRSGHRLAGKMALIPHIVNGKNRTRPCE